MRSAIPNPAPSPATNLTQWNAGILLTARDHLRSTPKNKNNVTCLLGRKTADHPWANTTSRPTKSTACFSSVVIFPCYSDEWNRSLWGYRMRWLGSGVQALESSCEASASTAWNRAVCFQHGEHLDSFPHVRDHRQSPGLWFIFIWDSVSPAPVSAFFFPFVWSGTTNALSSWIKM